MKLYEYEAKKVFDRMKIPIPKQYGVIHSLKDLDKLNIDFPVMLKSMVLSGGRGKAGGIKKANDLHEAKKLSEELFKLKIKGFPVESVLAEKAVDEISALYIGVTMDPADFNNVVIASSKGGVDIETVASKTPDAILKKEIPGNDKTLPKKIAEDLSTKLVKNLSGKKSLQKEIEDVISKLYETYQKFDARLCEINPLIITSKGLVAADAKLVLDDNSLYRQVELLEMLGIKEKRHDVSERTKNELKAQTSGFPYVDLLTEDHIKDKKKLYVGLVPGGAGYGIFSIDEVKTIGKRYFQDRVIPINFMDSGGGPPQNRVADMFHLLMDNETVDIIITSRFGGISSCDVFIRGMVQAILDRFESKRRMIPIYGRMVGTDLPSARAFLEKTYAENPEAMKNVKIVVGNQKIMADVIREGIKEAFESRGWKV
ncbi:MAG: acetate--CoA ligase family protein [Candidatus Thermoplasmatota archaeon]|nr:acetate--CoA ligase family protein [Candidatus Thermoplasmatota archaeon]